jgi:outer membrane protein TolC
MKTTGLFFVLCFSLLMINFRQANAQVTDKNLDYFINAAIKYSPLIRDLKNQQQAVKIDSLIARATSRPQVTATSAGMYAPLIHGYGYDEVLTNGQSLEAILNVNYDLLNKKRIANLVQGIKLQSDSIKYAGELSVSDLKRSIIDQYITTYADQQQIEFDREVLLLLKKEEVLLKQLTRNNVYKQAEYLTFLVTLQQQQLAVKQSELQYKNDYATLNYLSGIADTVTTALEQPKLDHQAIRSPNVFFTKKFDIDSLKNINQKTAIALNYKPKLGVYANSGYNSSLVLQPYKNFGASIGFTLSVPIYDGHQKKMQYDKIALGIATASGYKDFFIRQQNQQINMIIQQLAATDELFVQINEQIKFAKGLVDVDSKLLHTGDIRVSDYIIAINSYMAVKNLLKQTATNRLKLINQFNYWNK